MGRRKLEENLNLLSEAHDLNPYNPEVHALLGEVYTRGGNLEAALEHYKAAKLIDPDDVQAWRGYAYALQRIAGPEAAIEAYRALLQKHPRDPEAHNNLGVALAATGSVEEARRHFERALALRPNYADAKRNLAAIAR